MSGAWPYPAPLDDGGARHLMPGLRMPDVELPATTGGAVNLARHPGRAVLLVYPWTGRPGLANPPAWDDIPGAHGSTPEAEGFRDHYAAFKAAGVELFGLSGQDTSHQQEFAARCALPYALLSDAARHFGRALGLPTFATGGTTYLKRITLMLTGGEIAHVVYPVHPPDMHAKAVLELVLQKRDA